MAKTRDEKQGGKKSADKYGLTGGKTTVTYEKKKKNVAASSGLGAKGSRARNKRNLPEASLNQRPQIVKKENLKEG